METLKPRPLKDNDIVSIAAPAGPFDPVAFRKALLCLKKHFTVHYQKNIGARDARLPFLAGNDERRVVELVKALTDSASKAVLFARGGYGCQRLLPFLDKKLPKILPPKIVVGSSDVTVVLNYLWKRYRRPSLYGPMVAPHFHREGNVRRLKKILQNPKALLQQPLTAKAILRPGHASGTLIGGCLTLVVASLGTPWEMETEGKILFLEDTHEEAYSIDRMLTQLDQAGKFRGVRGIVLGTFRRKKNHFPADIRRVFEEKFRTFRGPVLWGMNFGHCPSPLLIPFGGSGRISGKQLILTKGFSK